MILKVRKAGTDVIQSLTFYRCKLQLLYTVTVLTTINREIKSFQDKPDLSNVYLPI